MRLHPLLLLLMIPSHAANAGAWLQPAGHGIAIAQATYFTSSEFFDADGALQSQDTCSKYELQPYVEYGWADNLTIGGSAYINHARQSGNANTGIADPELFARTRLWHSGTQTLAIQPLVKLPSYFRHSDSPRGGAKSIDAELSLLFGQTLHIVSERDYIDTRIGYRWRSRGRAPQLRADFSLGLQLSERWQMVTSMRQIVSEEVSTNFSENGDQDYESLKTEATAIYALDDRHWVQASVFDHIDGIMTGAGRGISIGYGVNF